MAEAKYILIDGKAVPYADAKVHVLAPAITYAAMVFEGIRGYWNEQREEIFVFRLDKHLQRLRESMRVMRYGADYSLAYLHDQVLEAVQVNQLRETIHLRVMVMITGVPSSISTSSPVSLVITAGPYAMKDWQQTGMSVGISSWQRVHESSSPPRIKTSANYSNGRLAVMQALHDGYDATVMLTREGKVSEGPVATLFMKRRGQLVTPAMTESILESITRETIIELAANVLGMPVVERPVDRTELYSAEELFFCGSGWEVVPITSVDGIPVNGGAPGPLTARIRDLYLDVVRGNDTRYGHWLTPVWSQS
jgi:branched-chain amino acid aminotransferase